MAKFNYKKWVTEYKNGKLLYEVGNLNIINEQTGSVTGSVTGSYDPCYACINGTVSQVPGFSAGQNICGSHPTYGPMYTDPNDPYFTNCTGSSSIVSCSQSDFSYNSQCGADWLDPAPGGANSWNGWLNARWNGYNSVGCQHFQNAINWIQQQLTTGTNAAGVPWNSVQIARKQAKQDWAGCMLQNCGC